MKLHYKFATCCLLISSLLLSTLSHAQKTKNKNIEKEEMPAVKAHMTKELEEKIGEVVRPAKEQLEKLLNEDATGNFTKYKDDLRRLNELKNDDERKALFQKMQKSYYPFIKKIWDQAKIDEKEYQMKIKNLFPPDQREIIRFTEFLNFTMSSTNQKPAPPPPPPPAPANICVNANNLFRGSVGFDGGAIGSAEVIVAPANPPSPAEIVVSAGTGILGSYRGRGWIRNTATVPATFPSNYKVLRSKKTFDWNGYASAATILGVCWSTVAFSTSPDDNNFSVAGEIHTAVAPLLYMCVVNKKTSRTEEEVFTKNNTRGYQFGITCYGTSTASIYFSYSHALSAAAIWKWEICEE